MEKSRRIFNEMIITKGNVGKFAVEWLEFYDLEKLYGDEKHQRKLLNRALNEVKDNAEKEIIYDLLFKFEKFTGNVNQYNAIYWKYQQFKQQRQIELANLANKKYEKPQNKPFKKTESHQTEKKPAIIAGDASKTSKPSQQLNSNNLKRKVSFLNCIQSFNYKCFHFTTCKKIKKSEVEEIDSKRKATEKIDNDGFLIPNLPKSSEQQDAKKSKSLLYFQNYFAFYHQTDRYNCSFFVQQKTKFKQQLSH